MNNTVRVFSNSADSAMQGTVVWKPLKSIWFLTNMILGLMFAPFYFSPAAFFVFLFTTAITLCLGHSLGMHRLLIHRSYECPKWMEYLLVYLGVLVGMAGPIGMIKQHDLRDWAQRQKRCHDYLKHGSSFIKDGWWQLNCDVKLDMPPHFRIESDVSNSRFYRVIEATWLIHAMLPAIPLYFFGGIVWVLWGLCVRVFVSLAGHWLIGFFAHNEGQRTWVVSDAAVQGHNIRLAGLVSMGEAWHNNHHAYPGSAMLGLHQDEPDPGWWVLNALHNLGIVKNIKLPEHLPERKELQVEDDNVSRRIKRVPESCKIADFIKNAN